MSQRLCQMLDQLAGPLTEGISHNELTGLIDVDWVWTCPTVFRSRPVALLCVRL